MKKYILALAGFIIIYICGMYLMQGHIGIKTAEDISAPVEQLLAQNNNSEKKSADSDAKKPVADSITPEDEELLRQKAEKERLALQKKKEEEERLQQEQIERDARFAEKGLVNIEDLSAQLFLDIRYATESNFTGEKLYSIDKCYLQKDTAAALEKAAEYALQEENPFYICVYDCYRPISAQKAMWDIHPVPGQVADPSTGSNHNRGTAVDVGPCTESGYEMKIPTQFDDFSEKAYAYAEDNIPEEAINNRAALQKVMRKAGFTTIRKEWWHFNYKDAKKYPVLDLEF